LELELLLISGGVTIFPPGSTVRANVPLSGAGKIIRSAKEATLFRQVQSPWLATPANFDPDKSWPVLVICSTSDFKRQNRDDLVQFIRGLGSLQVGCCWRGTVRNTHGTIRRGMAPGHDHGCNRRAPPAALPVRRSGLWHAQGSQVGPKAPAQSHRSLREAVVALADLPDWGESGLPQPGICEAQPGANFLMTPIYVSAGHDDRNPRPWNSNTTVARFNQTNRLSARSKSGLFRGGHEVNDAQTSMALRWFSRAAEVDPRLKSKAPEHRRTPRRTRAFGHGKFRPRFVTAALLRRFFHAWPVAKPAHGLRRTYSQKFAGSG